jgi:hypothetical protein
MARFRSLAHCQSVKIIMDRFRRGFFVFGPTALLYKTPGSPFVRSIKRIAPALLPGIARAGTQAPTKTEWKAILEARGFYEADMDKGRVRNLDRRSGRPLLGYNSYKRNDVAAKNADDSPIHEPSGAAVDHRGKTANDRRVQTRPDSV